jgi:hypothetical protein
MALDSIRFDRNWLFHSGAPSGRPLLYQLCRLNELWRSYR